MEVWEHEPQASVSTAFSSSPKLSRVFLSLDRRTKNFDGYFDNVMTKFMINNRTDA